MINALMTLSHGMTPLVVMARACAWAAAINFGLVSLAIIAPIFRLLFQLFNLNIMRHHFYTIHFHRNAAISAIFFSALHILLLNIHTHHYQCKIELNNNNSDSSNEMDICSLEARITGSIIITGMVGAWVTGYISRMMKSSILSILHFPFACIACFALFTHSTSNASLYAFASNFVLAIFVACLLLHSLFFFFNPILPMHVNNSETVWLSTNNKQFSLLVVNFDNSSVIPPGSFFLIYANQNSHLSYFHAHAFPVFSTQNKTISFLLQCRVDNSFLLSFTQRLSLGPYLIIFFFFFSLLIANI